MEVSMDIPFEGQLSKQDWRKINSLHFKPNIFSSLLRVAGLIVMFVLVLFLIHNNIYDSRILIILVFFFILLTYPFLSGYAGLLSYIRNKASIEPITGVINGEHIIFQTPNATVDIKWGLYKKVKQTKDLLLLYQNKNFFNYFPRSFFESDASWQAFLDLVQQKISKK
jgi:hypothetical protein